MGPEAVGMFTDRGADGGTAGETKEKGARVGLQREMGWEKRAGSCWFPQEGCGKETKGRVVGWGVLRGLAQPFAQQCQEHREGKGEVGVLSRLAHVAAHKRR